MYFEDFRNVSEVEEVKVRVGVRGLGEFWEVSKGYIMEGFMYYKGFGCY